jgi:uncharacterized beta-barrel protein YwiB (DUF1934 family)
MPIPFETLLHTYSTWSLHVNLSSMIIHVPYKFGVIHLIYDMTIDGYIAIIRIVSLPLRGHYHILCFGNVLKTVC